MTRIWAIGLSRWIYRPAWGALAWVGAYCPGWGAIGLGGGGIGLGGGGYWPGWVGSHGQGGEGVVQVWTDAHMNARSTDF